jgi:hypothetical protein
MTGISLHMQWPLTSQPHGSVSQREQLFCFFVTDQTPRPYLTVVHSLVGVLLQVLDDEAVLEGPLVGGSMLPHGREHPVRVAVDALVLGQPFLGPMI